jgi:glycosyltransferase involved in cell wall biosynthesis
MLTHPQDRLAIPLAETMTRSTTARVLVDLSHAADGYVGVAQDLRLIFAMLSELEHIEAAGLLMPTARHDLPRVRPGRADQPALTAGVLHWMERNWARTDRRILFARTLAPEQRARVLAQNYYATDLSVSAIIDRTVHLPVPMLKYLDAKDFDAVLFCMPRPVRLPKGVRQIMRFHDSVPVTDVDTVVNWKMAMAHSRLVRACADDAIFVCNSPQSRDDLISLDPRRERDAVVIPCALAPARRAPEGANPATVISRHATFRSLRDGEELDNARTPAGWQRPAESGLRYVLAVSTLEPRKNFCSLVRAWERVAARRDPGLKLVIVGGAGWREAPVLRHMAPHVESGQIYHLQSVPAEDLQTLMRHAACFASVSYNEGFGYSPLEATQAGAPCVISDLPVFRWIFGNAAVFVDPYDVDSIATGIERLTCLPTSEALVQELRSRAEPVLSRFRPAVVGEAWGALLEGLRK